MGEESKGGGPADRHAAATDAPARHAGLITDRRVFLAASAAGLASLTGCASVIDGAGSDAASTPPDDLPAQELLDGLERDAPGSYDRPARNVVLIIPDGAGRSQISAARYLQAFQADPAAFPANMQTGEAGLAVDQLSAVGELATYPADPNKLVTDSAAAGTAMATGHKTLNGVVGGTIDADSFRPRQTLLENAYTAGMATGLVTTTRITHATPATFAAHVPNRDWEDLIARQYLYGGHVDLLWGGGARHFRAATRADDRALSDRARAAGYTVVETASALANTNDLPTLGLFADSHLPYAVDRRGADSRAPDLDTLTAAAIERLQASPHGAANGFFLVVEAGRVDHLGHANHPAIAHEQLECDAALGAALAATGPDTLVVQTADHETGGLSLGHDAYDMDWARIANQATATDPGETDLGWTSGGHTGEEVPIYAAGPGAERFSGYLDNTALPQAIAAAVDLSV